MSLREPLTVQYITRVARRWVVPLLGIIWSIIGRSPQSLSSPFVICRGDRKLSRLKHQTYGRIVTKMGRRGRRSKLHLGQLPALLSKVLQLYFLQPNPLQLNHFSSTLRCFRSLRGSVSGLLQQFCRSIRHMGTKRLQRGGYADAG